MLTHFENGIIVFAPFVLPQKELIYYSGKTNSVMPADVRRYATRPFDTCSVSLSTKGGSKMIEPSTPSKKLQWKWVWIPVFMYVVFYFLPLALVPGGLLTNTIVTKASATFIGIWMFAGVFIIASVAGFISKGVTIKEPAIAAFCLVVLWGAVELLRSYIPGGVRQVAILSVGVLVGAILAGLLALAGAWFGERAQKLWRGPRSPESPKQQV